MAEQRAVTADMIPAEIRGEMYVQINPKDEPAIILAVQSLGTSAPSKMGDVVRDKVDSQVTDALQKIPHVEDVEVENMTLL